MLDFIFKAILIASVSWFYHIVLKDFLLAKWFEFGYDKFGRFEGTWKEYIYLPIWGCQYCTSGQLALWSFLFLFPYNIFYHVTFITLTVLFTKIIWKNLEQ